MSDTLSPEDAAAVERYISEGGTVTRVPTGESGLPELRWDGHKLSVVDDEQRKSWRERRGIDFGKGRRAVGLRNRAAVVAHAKQGLTAAEIAAQTGMHESTVRVHAREAGAKLTPRPKKQPCRIDFKRRMAVREAWASGMRGMNEIARHIGASRRSVERDLVALGLKGTKA